MDLVTGLYFLRDELAKILISGWENVDRFAKCGRLLDNIIIAVESSQKKGATENAGTTEADKRPAESGHN